MKRIIKTITVLLLLTACSKDHSDFLEGVTRQAAVTYLVTPNGLGDNGYNDAAAQGIFSFIIETFTPVRMLQPQDTTQAEQMYRQWLTDNADKDSAVLILGSSVYEQMARRVPVTLFGKGSRVLVEFVSANPTGPMHIGNSRGGALGDCLAAVLEYAGYYVEREFYVNDAGNQIQKFGLSLDIRYQQLFKGEEEVPLPEDSYHGADIIDLAKEFAEIHGDSYLNKSEDERRRAMVEYALPKNIARMKTDIAKYRIEYDTWFLESTLHSDGEVKEIIDILTQKGLTYEKDGALWYKATEFGGEKDEVLVRANGNPTYFAADIAYHRNKFEKRGFDTCIDVWGADHHGHVARMKGAMDAVGLDGSKLHVVLMQLVRLMDNGVLVKVSKRTGKAIQLADLLDEISVDAARFFFNLREANTQMDFDMGLAVREDSQNPVYYVQYAHARICSIFRRDEAKKFNPDEVKPEALDLLTHPSEVELIRYLSALPNEIIAAAKDYEPSRMTRYVIELASKYHKFYHDCRVLGNEDDNLTAARLLLCDCVRQVIANILAMLKVTAPEQMVAEATQE